MSETLVLARWMESSLPHAWRDRPLRIPKPRAQEKPSQVGYLSKISMPEFQTLFNQFVHSRQTRQKAKVAQPNRLQTVGFDLATAKEEATLLDNTKTLVVQATKYLVVASKKNQLPHQIAVEEFNTTAIDIVKFLEQLATQAGRQAKKASTEILAFSQQAQNSSSQPSLSMPDSDRLNIFQLTQGALRYIDPHSFFKDSQLYNQSVAKLSEMVARGVASETSVVSAKKKGLSF